LTINNSATSLGVRWVFCFGFFMFLFSVRPRPAPSGARLLDLSSPLPGSPVCATPEIATADSESIVYIGFVDSNSKTSTES
jgi:hypothetical protein